MIVQVITAKVIGDSTVASSVSTELSNYGWTGGTSNLPSAYLTGYLAGLRAKARGFDNAVLDIGLIPPVPGSKIYGALKGAVDAGLDVPHGEDVLPNEDRLSGKHIVDAFKYFSDNPGEGHNFSKLGKKKTTITSIPKQFTAAKKAMQDLTKAQLKKKSTKKKPAAKKPVKKTKKEKPEQSPPRAVPRKPKPKKLIARGRGKKGRRGKK
jgi:large subunit ribosomal protein L18